MSDKIQTTPEQRELDAVMRLGPALTPRTAKQFPNRTWPWRREDEGDPEAMAERAKRTEPDYHWENGIKVYHSRSKADG